MKRFFQFAAMAVSAVALMATSVYGESISGTLSKPTLNTGGLYDISKGTTDWVYWGASVESKAGGANSFGSATGGNTGGGGDSQIYISYSGGTPDASLTNSRLFSWGNSETFTHTLINSSEILTVYLVGWDTRVDVSATLSGSSASYSMTDAVLPATDGNGSGYKHTYGILTLGISGAIGETLTVTVKKNSAGVVDNSGNTPADGNVGLQAASVVGVPEPTSMILLTSGAVGLMVYVWRKRRMNKTAI